MTMFRKEIKRWLYESCPGVRGAFPYFGTSVYFPKGNCLFHECCRDGIFESTTLRMIHQLIKPDTSYLDVGANIGLMAVPLLRMIEGLQVISFEPSPNVLPYLEKTWAMASFRNRWRIVASAVGDSVGHTSFQLTSTATSAFEGFRSTGRVSVGSETVVPTTTLDFEWNAMAKPPISVIKIDVEGAELLVLHGARECIAANKPAIFVEWNLTNLNAYQCRPGALLEFANEVCYEVYSIPELSHVSNEQQLRLLSATGAENFVMLPACTSTSQARVELTRE